MPKRRKSIRASIMGVKNARFILDDWGMTQAVFAKRAGVSRPTVSRFLHQEHISLESFSRICESLGLEMLDILDETFSGRDPLEIKSVEFPPDCCQAITSILSYFSHILSVKYPEEKIKVKIEQEGLILRMVIHTPDGRREEIEKTFEEYKMVVVEKMQPEDFLDDPFEVIALKNKLELAKVELRQTRELLSMATRNSQQRIESLEVQVAKLFCIIEKGFQSGDRFFGVIDKMSEPGKSIYNLTNSKFGGGFAAEGGFQVGGSFVDFPLLLTLLTLLSKFRICCLSCSHKIFQWRMQSSKLLMSW